MKKIFLNKAEVHEDMYNRIVKALGDKKEAYGGDKFLKLLKDGFNDSLYYNRALRRVCTVEGKDVIAIKIINIMLDYSTMLGIHMAQTNNDGMSALDYARINNPVAHKLMVNRQNKDLEALVRQNASPLLDSVRPYVPQLDTPPCLVPTPSNVPSMTEEQAAIYGNTFTKVGAILGNVLASVTRDPSQIQTKEKQRLLVNQIKDTIVTEATNAKKLMYGQQHTTPDPRSILERLKEIPGKDEGTTVFVALYEQEKYEEAFRLAVTLKNSSTLTKVFEIFYDNTEHLPFKIDEMKDSNGRTPLHDAAIYQNWLVYYCLTGLGASGDQVDNAKMSAQDYRRRNQCNILMAGGNLMADLFASINPAGLPQDANPNLSPDYKR